MEKYGVKEVIELFVFNEDGKLVTTLNTLRNSNIISNENDDFLFVEDALLDINLLRFQQNSETSIEDDFKTVLNQIKGVPVTVNKNNKSKKCKLIAKSIMRDRDTGSDKYIYYEIPNAEILNRFEIDTANCEPSAFDILFKITSNEDGDLFTIYGL